MLEAVGRNRDLHSSTCGNADSYRDLTPKRIYKKHENQRRPQGFSLKKWVGKRETALGTKLHQPPPQSFWEHEDGGCMRTKRRGSMRKE